LLAGARRVKAKSARVPHLTVQLLVLDMMIHPCIASDLIRDSMRCCACVDHKLNSSERRKKHHDDGIKRHGHDDGIKRHGRRRRLS
jgi:hypothetical protein